ncbi:hydroxyethylthiazole kinase [Fredinandcohnia sp. QZ13]|uniref:hydroxyethylthiazole kinase n=1 Tax=Fredinandcohnia sp. QZ13 TaxID=3073144 RepID=UPI00285302BE|nr:hydroxyethylthiazole kinase [Fredinandcohnia sp. QZ13]MDR4886836.1 hydroxyethylthiazole kinase [Fredinandcohnia sp. QZ13]
MFEQILANVREKTPLVHNITNYVTVNDVANIVLACGGSPIMADDPKEVADITSICNALVINIGTLNERTIESMILAGKAANKIGNPVILDPVGAGASSLRTSTVYRLLDEVQFSVIRGNLSEIKTVHAGSGNTKGVDAAAEDVINEGNLDEMVQFAKMVSEQTRAVIAITGAIDIVANKDEAYVIRNGHPMMSKITGTGCMLTSVVAAYCGANPQEILKSTAAAVSAFGFCGELAYQKVEELNGGTSSFRTYLIDWMSKLDFTLLQGGMNIENR